jgi:hypothetical protein
VGIAVSTSMLIEILIVGMHFVLFPVLERVGILKDTD